MGIVIEFIVQHRLRREIDDGVRSINSIGDVSRSGRID